MTGRWVSGSRRRPSRYRIQSSTKGDAWVASYNAPAEPSCIAGDKIALDAASLRRLGAKRAVQLRQLTFHAYMASHNRCRKAITKR